MATSLFGAIEFREALRSLDEAIVALWASGTRNQGEIGKHVGLDQRSVSRRITRMVRRGAWPFADRPNRGRSPVPVATTFAAVPIRPERMRAAAGEPSSGFPLAEAAS
jgi:hypothetical protein